MIWNPFKKTDESTVPLFQGLRLRDDKGILYVYKPSKTISSYDVALLWPVAMTETLTTDRWAYIRANNLEKHFKPVNTEE